MFTRATALVIFPFWAVAMGWLVVHDVLPGVTAMDPPRLEVRSDAAARFANVQYAIESRDGRIGTLWSEYLVDGLTVQRRDVLWLDDLPVPVAPLRVVVSSWYRSDGLLDEFTLDVSNRDASIQLHGERFHAAFSFELDSSFDMKRTFKLPLADAGLVSGALNPFADLSGLKVGRTWRMQVFNPVAALLGIGDQFIPMLVRVTGKERIITADGPRDCFVVESGKAKAWVDDSGLVHAQEVDLPIVGVIKLSRLAGFDKTAVNRARMRPLRSRS